MNKKNILLLLLSVITILPMQAKSYPFDMKHPYEVQIVRVGKEGTKFLKVYGKAGNADKAIERAMQDAVAACIFTGVEGTAEAGKILPLCGGRQAYEEHKEYFDKFFKKGEFMNYVKNTNSGYPSGENNVAVSGGRRVGIFVSVMYDALRKKLEQDGIIKSLDSYF